MNRILILVISSVLAVSFFSACRDSSENRSSAVAGSEEEQLYTCGMHPHVIQHGPGTCPICGMDLMPVKGGGGSSAAVANSGGTTAAPSATGERKIKYWQAPMDPTFIADKPGKSPMGMDLVPVYEDEAPEGTSNAVTIDPVVIQNMGVRVERAKRQTIYRHVRTIGEVEVGEDQISVVNLRFSGWVEKIYLDRTGDPVEKGEKLFDIYSPGLVAAQEEYLLALRAQGRDSELARSARRKLELWDLSKSDIEAVAKSRKVRRVMPIRSPRSGFVLNKSVVEGARIREGEDLYHIGDLSRIWVTADVYEYDAPWVEVGQPAQMELTYQKGSIVEGNVAYIYPTLNPKSRTLRVRLEFENPDYRLKPGMFATVYIQYRRRDEVLAIPSEAILHSGKRELVFVTKGDGRFEPREITTGLQGDRRLTEVLSGLEEGALVVTSGQFLIDSESQLQEAIQKMLARRSADGGDTSSTAAEMEMSEMLWSCPMHLEEISSEPGRCPLCGMDFEERLGTAEELDALRHAHSGHGDSKAGQYACPMHPELVSDAPGRCSICGMFLEEIPDEEGSGQ